MEIYKASRTDEELVANLRSWFRLKGDYAILEAAERLQSLSAFHAHEPLCPVCRDTAGDCNACGGAV